MLLHDKRAVVHMDLDTFFVSVERLRDSRLQGRPLIIGGTGDRGVVASCSYETRAFGVRSAMPIGLARRLCPQALVISGDMELYSNYSKTVTEVIRERAPLFEKASIDEFYIDMTGMERFHGCYSWAGELRNYIRQEVGLPISFGLSVNKMVSKIATGVAKPDGQIRIQYGEEQPFLDPLPVSKIPMVGEKTTLFLANMGIRQVRTLREVPRDYMRRILGKNGDALWQHARGIDESPVVPYSEQKSISTERTFGQDTIDVRGLRATITAMTERIAYQLREQGRLCSCITVKIRYANFDTLTKQARIPYNSADQFLSHKANELFESLFDRRLRVRLVGVRFSGLISGGQQINLFDNTEKKIQLYEAIDKIKYRFGAGAIMSGTAFGGIRNG